MRCTHVAPIAATLGLVLLVAARPAAADVPPAGPPGDVPRILSIGVNWIAKMSDARTDTRTSRAAADEVSARATTPSEHPRRTPIILLPDERLALPPAPAESARRPAAFPRVSVVARDWNRSYAVVGTDIPSDNIRVTRSSRMAVMRVSMGEAWFEPFAHFAVGEWRYDPSLLPLVPWNQEYATQFGGGVSIELFKSTKFVWESTYTVLVREARDPENHPSPRVVGTFAMIEARL
jgi:hypothetical protein